MADKVAKDFYITPPFRMGFPSFFKPARLSGKFEVTACFPKGVSLAKLNAMAQAAIKKKWKNPPDDIVMPWRDADKPGPKGGKVRKEYSGCITIPLRSEQKPTVMDPYKTVIDDPRRIVPGFWAWALVNAYAWHNDLQGDGVSFGLQHIQLLPIHTVIEYYKDQANIKKPITYDLVEEPFGSVGPPAEDVFGELDNPGDDAGEYGSDGVEDGDDFMDDDDLI